MKEFKVLKSLSYFVIVPLLTYLELSAELVGILCTLIVLDIITAIIREYATGNRIRSRMFWIGVSAKMLLILIPFVVILVGKGAGINLLPMARITLSIFIVAEGYSIIGNIMQTRMKDETLDEQDAITAVIKNIEKMLKKILGALMAKEGIENNPKKKDNFRKIEIANSVQTKKKSNRK